MTKVAALVLLSAALAVAQTPVCGGRPSVSNDANNLIICPGNGIFIEDAQGGVRRFDLLQIARDYATTVARLTAVEQKLERSEMSIAALNATVREQTNTIASQQATIADQQTLISWLASQQNQTSLAVGNQQENLSNMDAALNASILSYATNLQSQLGSLASGTATDFADLRSNFNSLQEVTERVQVELCNDNLFSTHQQIFTSGALAWESFSINGTVFLVVANSQSSFSNFAIKSVIYRFNTSTGLFDEFQQIDTLGAYLWEYFAIDGAHFLAVANRQSSSTDFTTQSTVYEFSINTSRFDPHQSINTANARSLEAFVINNQTYLFIGNQNAAATNTIKSEIYLFNSTSRLFELVQQLNNNFGARGSEFFTVTSTGLHYLAVANEHGSDTNSVMTKSVIYLFNPSSGQFDAHQLIDTAAAIDWEHFEISGIHYLAVANHFDGTSRDIMSVVYRLDPMTSQFVPHQQIATKGAIHFDFFTVGSEKYLAVANNRAGSGAYNVDSVIYRYNTVSTFFEAYQPVRTSGGSMLHYFNIDSVPFLAVANQYDGATFNINSVIFKLNDFCLPAGI